MLEIEQKILEVNVTALVLKIKKLKPRPKKIFEGLVKVKYFDFPDGRIRRKKDLLRMRVFLPSGKPSFTELVYKTYRGVKKGCKYFDELEFVIPGQEEEKKLRELFRQLGLTQTLYYEKRRILYSQGKIKFEIDEHPKIPPFLEIEAPSPAHIKKYVKLLSLEGHEQTAESIGELLKRKYPEIRLNKLRF